MWRCPTSVSNLALPKPQAAAAAARQDGEQLVWEVWDVVDRDFLDARGAGFDRVQWAAARDAALAGSPPAASHMCQVYERTARIRTMPCAAAACGFWVRPG